MRNIGGGGGHTLHVKKFTMLLRFKSFREEEEEEEAEEKEGN